MKILSVVNSFKGTASSKEINSTIKDILSDRFSVNAIAVSDGGDGFLDCFREGARQVTITTTGPFMDMKVEAEYLIKGKDAFIEIANICGIRYLTKDKLNPLKATTYGIAYVISDAISHKAQNIYIGLGGTAANDAGAGLAYGLGALFLDKEGNSIFPDIEGLLKIEKLDLSKIKIPKGVNIYAICDVKNKLLGRYGSARVFGPQKGASQKDINLIEKALKNLTLLIKKCTGRDISKIPGGASAGGLASGLYGFFNAKVVEGSRFVIEKLNLEKMISLSDIVITGEGRFDRTSLYGKITGEIIKLAKRYGKRCILITAVNDYNLKNVEIIELSKKYPLDELLKSPLKAIKEELLKHSF